MFCDNIDGYCDFIDFYKQIANDLQDDDIFVEVGVWKGKSLAGMIELVKTMNKKIHIYAIDTWSGSFNEIEHLNFINSIGGDDQFFLEFLQTMKLYNMLDDMFPVRLPSAKASLLFNDDSITAIFIDAAHDYDSVKADIECWYPKIKIGGTISGHDYYIGSPASEGLIRAVNEKFTKVKNVCGSCWMYVKEL